MFRFANPQLLWLLVAVPVMIIAFAVVLQLRKRNLHRFGNVVVLIGEVHILTDKRLFEEKLAIVLGIHLQRGFLYFGFAFVGAVLGQG